MKDNHSYQLKHGYDDIISTATLPTYARVYTKHNGQCLLLNEPQLPVSKTYCTYLQNFLYLTCNVIVFLSNNIGVHNSGGGVKGVHGRIDAQFRDGT